MAEATSLEHSDPKTFPLDKIDVSRPELMQTDTHWGYFERLREEDPMHYCSDSLFGPYWSITKFNDILAMEKTIRIFPLRPASLCWICRRILPPPTSSAWTHLNTTCNARLCRAPL